MWSRIPVVLGRRTAVVALLPPQKDTVLLSAFTSDTHARGSSASASATVSAWEKEEVEEEEEEEEEEDAEVAAAAGASLASPAKIQRAFTSSHSSLVNTRLGQKDVRHTGAKLSRQTAAPNVAPSAWRALSMGRP